jgi:hypothetical protein
MVRQDLWDAKAIAQPSDMRGRVVDGSNSGSPIDFLLKQALRAGGLTPADVRVSERLHTASDQLEALRNKAVEVSGSPEPQAGEFEAQGVAHRWVSFSTISPEVVRSFQGPAYPSLHGEVNLDSLTRIQQFWMSEKLVTAPVDVNRVVNLGLLRDAQKSLGY